MTKKVIIVEDNEFVSDIIRMYVEDKGYEVECFFNFHDTEEYIHRFIPPTHSGVDISSITAVIFDFTLDSKQDPIITSVPLVKMFKRIPDFRGILLANSSDPFHNDLLLEAGCTHTPPGKAKENVLTYLEQILP